MTSIPSWLWPLLATLVLLAPLLVPVIRFLLSGWYRKRQEIISYFLKDTGGKKKDKNETSAIEAYFKQFPPEVEVGDASEKRKLEKVYYARLGIRLYILPLVLIVVTAFPLAWIVSNTILAELKLFASATPAVTSLLPIPLAAIAGAYLWIANDFILADWRRSLLPTDLYQAFLRIIIAVPLGYAFSALFKPELAPFFAFAIGAFPLEPLKSLFQRTVLKRLEQKEANPIAEDAITKLQGIDSAIAVLFNAESIYTISQLTTTDPIRLAMRTNLDFPFVIDCVSQALAWIYLNDKLNKIRPFGLRGAFEINTLMTALDYSAQAPRRMRSEKPNEYAQRLREHQTRVFDRTLAADNLLAVAIALEMKKEAVERLFYEIAEDPYTELLPKIWH